MTLKIIRPCGEMKQQREKIAEYHEGEIRGDPRFASEFEWLEGEDDEEWFRTFDEPPYIAMPLEVDNGGPEENKQLGWFPDPDWEPEEPEYQSGQRG